MTIAGVPGRDVWRYPCLYIGRRNMIGWVAECQYCDLREPWLVLMGVVCHAINKKIIIRPDMMTTLYQRAGCHVTFYNLSVGGHVTRCNL